jgi:hypothetical protein
LNGNDSTVIQAIQFAHAPYFVGKLIEWKLNQADARLGNDDVVPSLVTPYFVGKLIEWKQLLILCVV